jgi:arsenate reductase
VARVLTDTYTGIAPQSTPGFLAAQIAGLLAALALVKILEPQKEEIR